MLRVVCIYNLTKVHLNYNVRWIWNILLLNYFLMIIHTFDLNFLRMISNIDSNNDTITNNNTSNNSNDNNLNNNSSNCNFYDIFKYNWVDMIGFKH